MNKAALSNLIFGVASVFPFVANAQTEDRPNIILFVSDDHGTDALGCYGNDKIQTPNLDALAKKGVIFENAFCTASTSAASRSVLLTGKFGHAIGVYGHTHDYHHFSAFEGVQSLPIILSENGYYTARVGKYHLAPESVYHFDEVYPGSERNPVEMANNSVKAFEQDKPFFLYFCTGDPHRSDPFKPEVWSDPNMFGNQLEGYTGVKEVTYSPDDVIVPDFLPDNEVTRTELAQYYQSVSRMDTGLGHLIKQLEKSGKADNTIIIYIADNGMAFPTAKTTLYEPGMKLPCIVAGPGVNTKKKKNQTLVSWADWTPTLLDIAGVEFDKKDFHGRSFAGVIDGTDKEPRKQVYASHTFHEVTMYYPMRVVREDRYKLIWNIAYQLDYPFASDLWNASTWQAIHRQDGKMFGYRPIDKFLQRGEFELYDLKNDPRELNNLALNPKYNNELERLKKDLKQWQLRTRDPWFIMWDNDMSMQNSGEGL